MLILSRKEKESIVIDGNIEITVVDIGEGRVRLGIKAPKDKEVHRKEVYLRIKEEVQMAAKGRSRMKDLEKLPVKAKKKKE